VASFYPLWEAAHVVGGRHFDVINLTPAGVEPHDLELSPKQLDQILDASVLLYLGKGFQPAVEDAARQRDGTSVDLLTAIRAPLRAAPAGEEATTDPHVWLDPVLMEAIVSSTAEALTRADPSAKAVFERNAAAYRGRLSALDRGYRTGLAHCDRNEIVTSHAAFGYLAARYGLQQIPITGLSPEAEPDPKRLAQLEDLVRREGITTVFTEELVSPRVADTLARETGVKTAVLSPLEGLTASEQAAGDDYITVMERNLATLREALGCR